MKFVVWSLLSFIIKNKWLVLVIEYELEGFVGVLLFKGWVDLVLERGIEWVVVDLKWWGIYCYFNLFSSGEDI